MGKHRKVKEGGCTARRECAAEKEGQGVTRRGEKRGNLLVSNSCLRERVSKITIGTERKKLWVWETMASNEGGAIVSNRAREERECGEVLKSKGKGENISTGRTLVRGKSV